MRRSQIPDEVRRRFHQMGALIGWRYKSQVLMHAANRLYEAYVIATDNDDTVQGGITGDVILEGDAAISYMDELLTEPYLLLAGYAIENLFKDIIAHKNRPKILTILSDLKIEKTHNLLKLAHRAGVELLDVETEVLTTLTRTTTWDGKYPVPLTYEENDNLLEQRPSPSDMRATKVVIDNLVHRLSEIIRSNGAPYPKNLS